MATVHLKGISKTFDRSDTPALRPLDLEIPDTEFVVLVGPSGCGKSTLLRIIAGLEEPTTGTVWIDGRDVTHVPPKDRDIAMVFQNYALYPHMSVFDNMAFGLKLRKYPPEEIRRRVGEAADVLGIEEYLRRKPKELSGGQRQRVALGRAIVRHPRVFLFDEPLSNLDATMRVAMRAELSRLHQRLRTTMVYVTHDQTEAMTMGDRIVVMRAGEIQQVADPLTLYHQPRTRFVAGFIGSPAMNFLLGRLVTNGAARFTCGAVSVPLSDALARLARTGTGEDLVLGIRPEDVLDGRAGAADAPRVAGRVEVVEPMGNETFVHATIADGVTVVSRGEWAARPHVGETIEIALRLENAHLFDPRSGSALA